MQNRFKLLRGRALAAALLFFPFAVSAQISNVQPRITAAVNESQLTTLRGNTHPFARPEFDRGAAPDSLPMERMLLVLKRSAAQEAALDTLMDQQQDQASPNYHAWLTPQQFGQQFGPADQDIQTITLWLESQGFTVNRVSNGRMVIEFSGTAGQVSNAFHTEIHRYNVNGEDHWANASDPQIPTALTPVVAGIDTLHNFPRKPMHRLAGIFSGDNSTGRSNLIGAFSPTLPLYTVDAVCGLDRSACYSVLPYDFAAIYNVLPLWSASIDGTGETIAIVSESDIYTPDFDAFRSATGLPAGNLEIIHNGLDPGILAPGGDEGESDLDVEWAGGVAKGATLDLVVSATTNTSLGVDLSAQYAVDNNLAPILSVSYGVCEFFLGTAGNQFYNAVWQQAAAQGITVLTAAGDSGSAVCDRNAGTQGAAQFGLTVSGFSSTPYNVAVGGTDFNDLQNPLTYWNPTNDATTLASVKGYIPEMTWNDSCTNQEVIGFFGLGTAEQTCNSANAENDGFTSAVGGSGGASNCTVSDGQNESSCSGGYSKPLWQTGPGVPNDGVRDVPDVSLFAADGLNANFYAMCEVDVSGYPLCGNNSGTGFDFLPVGGTSVSTPAFAGIMAMVDQETGSRQGNANYILYQLAAQSGASCNSSNGAGTNCVFYDVTNGTIAMPCAAGSPNCSVSTAGDQVGVLSANNSPAYNTTAGYDLATGLGSVNVANLVNHWASLSSSLKLSSTSLVLNGGSAVSITHGQHVSFTATVGAVPPTTGTPTGNLSLIANAGPDGQESVQGFQLTNGSVASTTNALPGGNYTVTAHYPGDGTFAASNSSPGVNVTVNAEPSTTAVQAFTIDQNDNSIPFTTGPFGTETVYLRTNVAGQSGAGVATGTVNLSDTFGGMTTNFAGDPYQLNSSGNTMTPLPGGNYMFPATGTHSIVAAYSGDASFNPSTSPAISFTITKAPTSATLSLFGCTQNMGQCILFTGSTITLSAYASDNTSPVATQPTGTLAFFSNGAQLGPAVTTDNGGASITTSQLSLGENNITVEYSGDANYAGSSSAATPIDVVIPTNVAMTTSATSIAEGQSITFTAQVTANQSGPAITGSVQFLCNGSNLGSPVNLSGGIAQFTTTSLPLGVDDVGATYGGNTDYYSASSVVPVTVTSGPTFVVTANPTTIPVTAPGQSGSTVLKFIAEGGFSSGGPVAVTPTCNGLPSETMCSSGASITIPANGSAMAMVTFQTTAPSAVIPASRNRPDIDGWRLTAGSLALASLLCAAMLAFGYREKRRCWGVALMFTAFALLALSGGCGSGGGSGVSGPPPNSGTPAGNYNGISVTVTINGVTQTVSGLTLDVQ
jgi:Pro-kumamolisin, activation domain/Bacterial Ig-like domain (group 3)